MLPMQSAAFTSAVDDLACRPSRCLDHVAPDAGFRARRGRGDGAGCWQRLCRRVADRRCRAPHRPIGAAGRAGPSWRRSGGSFGNLCRHARHRRRSVLGRWRRQGRERFRRGQGEPGRRLPLHRIDRSGDAYPQGRRHSRHHGRRAHQQPDRPQVQDRLAGVPDGAALRRGRGCGDVDAGRAVASGILRHHR